ncbi:MULTISPECIES: polysaccharide biosynthesis tyrosine autokinase [unclassified Luteococcus]|uniref:polysaccharide biosynthesis tyrosine autokinase n=1 Tax=unclassified Luteococcus TaxID=2639923 RepID=UPI00313AF67F
MDLQDYLRIARRRWRAIVAMTTLMVALAALVTILTPKSYQSTAQLFVSTSGGDTNADLAQGSTFTQKQMKTYSQVIASPKVLDPVRKKLKVEPGAPLADALTATSPPDTVLINVAVTDRDPAKAARTANAVAEEFTSTVQELQAVKADKDSPVKATVIKPAEETKTPTSPRPLRNLVMGLLAGLLLGLGLALLRDRMDTSVAGERDVKEITDETIIGAIPFDSQAPKQPLIVQSDPMSSRSEAFRTLRTNLQFVDIANHPKVFVLTSSLPGEGKSTTAANLALTLGASGSTVCVIEGDLRRPQLLNYMGLEGGVGLTSVLIGETELEDVLQPFGENLYVLGAGPIPPNPSELLGSETMRALLNQLRDRFDYVIIDAPPLLPVTDAAVVSRLADGAIVVVGAGVIKKENVTRALESLDTVEANVLGIVMNRVPTKGRGGYYYYGERYGYRQPAKPEMAEALPQSPAIAGQGGGTPSRAVGTIG